MPGTATADSGNWYYEVLEPGFKYNLSDLQSAIGIHQFASSKHFTAARTRYAALYNELFAGRRGVRMRARTRRDCRHAWHLYMLRLHLEKLAIIARRIYQACCGIAASAPACTSYPFRFIRSSRRIFRMERIKRPRLWLCIRGWFRFPISRDERRRRSICCRNGHRNSAGTS